ncbi:hypothetical protein A2U01_0020441, partial [Trifolium medium]|nr:hypothetical protein [Trifolium medium]
MAKTKRNAPRTLSTPAEVQVEIQDPPSIEPTEAQNPTSIHDSEVQNPPSIEPTEAEIQDPPAVETTQVDDENPQPTCRRKKSNKYWPVDVIDKDGVVQETSLAAKDLFAKLRGRKVILEWNQFIQPIREAAGLLEQYLGELAANFENFPIWYKSWPDVPIDYKTKIWSDIK